jgi:hypothetical protein
MLSDMVPLKKWSMLLILISCVYHLDPVPPSLHAWSYFSRLDFENTVWTLRNSACNRLLCQNKVMQSYVKFMQWFRLADFLLGSCSGPLSALFICWLPVFLLQLPSSMWLPTKFSVARNL